ncbi:hypothetical protein Afe04nite_56370 [Asanoa ferruginea]|nr:hypothetical protein Afe04nite_56370 [Asanoa ferruginea]
MGDDRVAVDGDHAARRVVQRAFDGQRRRVLRVVEDDAEHRGDLVEIVVRGLPHRHIEGSHAFCVPDCRRQGDRFVGSLPWRQKGA